MAQTSTNIQSVHFIVSNVHPMCAQSVGSQTYKVPCCLLLTHKEHDHPINIYKQNQPPIVSLDSEEEDALMEAQSSYTKEYQVRILIHLH